jgi:hypothetical protein
MDLNYLKAFKSGTDRFAIEAHMVRAGGTSIAPNGVKFGNGLAYHFKEAIRALLPHFKFQPWSELLVENFILRDAIGIAGPASSGKTYTMAACVYTFIQIWPSETSVIMSTTTVEALQRRVWGAVKEIHNKAKKIRPWLPGRVMESKCALAFGDVEDEALDCRDSITGVACKIGGTWVGISNYVGLKNDRIVLIADEAHLMERGFLDACANLRKGAKAAPFKMVAMGNPKDTADALGTVCEPSVEDGGWEAYDPQAKTRTWKTKAKNGVAIQLCGYDTPNGDAVRGEEPYPGIILKEDIKADADYYGTTHELFLMMDLGIFPTNSIEKRVITTTLCDANDAFSEVVWESKDAIQRCIGVDAAYSGVGGDRCVLTDIAWGPDITGKQVIAFHCAPIIIPVNTKLKDAPEDQIALYMKEYCEREGIPASHVGLDSTGKGTLVGALARLWSPNTLPIEFGGKPTDRIVQAKDDKRANEAYGKFVTELWFAARSTVVSRQVRQMPRDVAREGASRAWDYTKGMKQDVEPKERTKERLGRSPDLFDSFVVALEVARRNGFEIANVGPVGVRSGPRVGNWLRRQMEKVKATRKELVEANATY